MCSKWEKCFQVLVSCFILFLSVPSLGEEAPKTTVDKLLDILQEKNIINGQQYRDLKNELGAEKKVIEEQKKVIEEQKKVVADVKSREEKMPRMGYKNGFYLETPDQNFSLKIGGVLDADMRFLNT